MVGYLQRRPWYREFDITELLALAGRDKSNKSDMNRREERELPLTAAQGVKSEINRRYGPNRGLVFAVRLPALLLIIVVKSPCSETGMRYTWAKGKVGRCAQLRPRDLPVTRQPCRTHHNILYQHYIRYIATVLQQEY